MEQLLPFVNWYSHLWVSWEVAYLFHLRHAWAYYPSITEVLAERLERHISQTLRHFDIPGPVTQIYYDTNIKDEYDIELIYKILRIIVLCELANLFSIVCSRRLAVRREVLELPWTGLLFARATYKVVWSLISSSSEDLAAWPSLGVATLQMQSLRQMMSSSKTVLTRLTFV